MASKLISAEQYETLRNNIKPNEGSKAYQTKIGSYKNQRFWVYKDSLGLDTIGYGHLVRAGEDFSKGLDEVGADTLLDHDIDTAISATHGWIPLTSQPAQIQLLLIEMVFQLGPNRAAKFIKFTEAINHNNYALAATELENSSWYTQTPARVKKHIGVLKSIK